VQRRHALAEAPQDHHASRARVARSRERRVGEDVEDAFARATAVFDDRRAVARMRRLVGWERVAVWTAKPLWVERVTQQRVAPVFVEQVLDRKVRISPIVNTRFARS
jgi:hypothetical protein